MNIKYHTDDVLEYYHILLDDYKYNLVVSGGMIIESLSLKKVNWTKNDNYFSRNYKIIPKIKN